MDINGSEVTYEPDEERNYRAIVDPEKLGGGQINVDLLKAIAEAFLAFR